MSRELGVSSYEGDVTEEASEPLLIELAQDSGGMGRVGHLCWGGHGASLDGGEEARGGRQRLGGGGEASEIREVSWEGLGRGRGAVGQRLEKD